MSRLQNVYMESYINDRRKLLFNSFIDNKNLFVNLHYSDITHPKNLNHDSEYENTHFIILLNINILPYPNGFLSSYQCEYDSPFRIKNNDGIFLAMFLTPSMNWPTLNFVEVISNSFVVNLLLGFLIYC